ncbi:MAG: hypothetical protein AAF688_10805 [Bacteroidota bacterium]
MKKIFFIYILTVGLSCSKTKKPPFDLPINAEILLTADSTKTWKLARRFNNNTRISVGDCFLSYQVTYSSDHTILDNNGEHEDCGDSMSSNWSLYFNDDKYPYIKLKGGNVQELMHLEKDYKYFKILDLSEEQLVLEFQHKQFSNKTTKLINVFVPKDAVVKDRKFHW